MISSLSRQAIRALVTVQRNSHLKAVVTSCNDSNVLCPETHGHNAKTPIMESNIGLRSTEDFRAILVEKEKLCRDTIAEDLDIFKLDQKFNYLRQKSPHEEKLYAHEEIQAFLENRLGKLENKDNTKWNLELAKFIQLTLKMCSENSEIDFYIEEDKLAELDNFMTLIKECKNEICFRDLFTLVLALSLWPSMITRVSIPYSKTQVEDYSGRLIQLLDGLCWERIHWYTPEKDSIFLRDIWRKIVMAKAWLQVLPTGYKEANQCAFPIYMIDKWANDSTSYSRRFFSKFTPRTLVDLAKVMSKLKTLPEGFHKYYAFYKLCEFIDHYDVEETAFLLKVYCKHNIRVPMYHPMMIQLNNKISQKLASRLNEDLLSLHGTYFRNVITDCKALELIIKKATFANYLSINSLLKIMTMKANSPQTDDLDLEDLKQLFVRRYIDVKDSELSFEELVDLHRLIALDQVPTNEPQLLARMLENAIHLFQTHRKGCKLDKLLLVLHFAYRGIFDQRLYNDGLLLVDGLFRPDELSRMKIQKSILFGRFQLERKVIKILDGLNKINGRDYLRLSQNDLNALQAWHDYQCPYDNYDFEYSAIPSIICQVFNQPIDMTCDPTNFVVRTSILPFTEMIDYVFCTDSNNNLIPLPEEFKMGDNVNSQCRRIPETVKQYNWHVLSILQRTRLSIISESMIDRRFTLFKHISDLGYKIHLFDVSTNRNGQVEVTPTMDDFKQFCIHNLH